MNNDVTSIEEVFEYMEAISTYEVINELTGEQIAEGKTKGGPLPVNPGYIHEYNGIKYRITNIDRGIKSEKHTFHVKMFAVPV
jgi:hypothetical protein